VQVAPDGFLRVSLDGGAPERLELRAAGTGLFGVRLDEGRVFEVAVERRGTRVAVVVGPLSVRYKFRDVEPGGRGA